MPGIEGYDELLGKVMNVRLRQAQAEAARASSRRQDLAQQAVRLLTGNSIGPDVQLYYQQMVYKGRGPFSNRKVTSSISSQLMGAGWLISRSHTVYWDTDTSRNEEMWRGDLLTPEAGLLMFHGQGPTRIHQIRLGQSEQARIDITVGPSTGPPVGEVYERMIANYLVEAGLA